MGLKNVKPKTGLFIIVPVVVAMLVFGICNWPKGKSVDELMKRTKEINDSIKTVESRGEVK